MNEVLNIITLDFPYLHFLQGYLDVIGLLVQLGPSSADQYSLVT